MGDEFDSGDDVFDGMEEEELVKFERSGQTQDGKRKSPGVDDVSGPDQLPKRQKASHASTPNPSHLALAERLLSEKFGYSAFRHEQAGAIQQILAGQNSLVIFPTGAGKSLCYQIPAIAFPELDQAEGVRETGNSGVTIVVSPLIALMKDQVDALQKRGISADCIDSTKSWDQLQLIYASLRKGELRLLYCAPERLNNEGFVDSVKNIAGGIRLLAVDEAHCISEWGHSFRPDYLKARFVDEIQAERVVCLTATATPKVAEDIREAFRITESCVFRTSPYRPNLHLYAKTLDAPSDPRGGAADMPSGGKIDGASGKRSKSQADSRFEEMFAFLKKYPGPTLVYVALQAQAETCAEALKKKGFNAAAFHAGMKTEEKQVIQDNFMSSKTDIICATIAFGMGIDKPDIRNVIHWDLSNSVEEYSQQIGRAGRDGEMSRCMFYLSPSAFYLRELFARGDCPSRLSLKNFLQDIFNQAAGIAVDGVFKTSHYSQSRDFDIRPSPLSIIYAALELRFGLIRAVTPEYSKYQFEPTNTYYPVLKNDKSPEGKAIFSNSAKKTKYYHVDVNAIAKASGLNRNGLVKKLNSLNENGHIRLQTSGVEHRYRILKPLPDTDAEVEALTDKLHTDLLSREQDAVVRGRQVMDLFTDSKCFALALVEHFGMELPEGKTSCGHCTFCETGVAVKSPESPREETTAETIAGVLAATDVRDDPRFLARVAFGIRSPRATRLKLDKTAVFQSLANHDFEDLLREFTKACEDSANA